MASVTLVVHRGLRRALAGKRSRVTLDAAADPGPLPQARDLRVAPQARSDRRPRLLRLPGTYPVQADTWLLADTMTRLGLASGACVLDLCTGTGALALAAAAAGATEVTGVDLSRRSVLNARLNGFRNGIGAARFVRGDLYSAVEGRRFDLVLSNPPYVPSLTTSLARRTLARCWDGGPDGRQLLDRIIAGSCSVLRPGGSVLIVHSSVCDTAQTLASAAAYGLKARVVEQQHEPFGPVMRARAAMMRDRGLVREGQTEEEIVVVHAVRPPGTIDRSVPS